MSILNYQNRAGTMNPNQKISTPLKRGSPKLLDTPGILQEKSLARSSGCFALKYHKCLHTRIERVKKNNGIQNTVDPNMQFIFGNCLKCGTTLTIGKIVNGKEVLTYNRQLGGVVRERRGMCVKNIQTIIP